MINKNKGKLVILVGIDGSGKSTQIANLKERGYKTSYWRDLESINLDKKINFKDPSKKVQHYQGKRRLEFIYDYINAEKFHLIDPVVKKGFDIISDGFFVRFFAKEKVYNKLSIEEFLKITPLDGNELMVMIDVHPEQARKRKQAISPYECFKGSDDFVEFQKNVRFNLINFIIDYDHIILQESSPEKIQFKLVNFLVKNKIKPQSK